MQVLDAIGQVIFRGDIILTSHKNQFYLLLCHGFKNANLGVKVLHDMNFISNCAIYANDVIKLTDTQLDGFYTSHPNYEAFHPNRRSELKQMQQILYSNEIPEFDKNKSNISWIFHRLYANGRILKFDEYGFAIYK